ncbi:MmoB/DmpM family protein [Mycolicibacterium sp.]|uniref:MmoB/DmpM family protein n=1 Tax=Mycolicibacterium sp. TaxID=2320850 RepID=UPI0037C8CDC9
MTAAGIRTVGVDLQASSEDNRRIIEAIERDNPDCTVSNFPGLIKIQNPGRLVVRRETIEQLLGRDWETHEFQMAIVSYYGNIQEWDDDEIVIAWDH